jgi:hypothetical protein
MTDQPLFDLSIPFPSLREIDPIQPSMHYKVD